MRGAVAEVMEAAAAFAFREESLAGAAPVGTSVGSMDATAAAALDAEWVMAEWVMAVWVMAVWEWAAWATVVWE
jgi:hypothetical protein